ncbi:MAG: hypothetical protein LBQ94_09835 [Treponema sp.]|jgi:hypothetical protein|nr:hypothetical protein [Treponema sp.]
MKKVFLFLTVLLFALSISAFAGGTTEAAQDVLDLLRGIEQATTPSGGGSVPPAPTGLTAATNSVLALLEGNGTIEAITYGNDRFIAVGWTGMAYCDW